MGGATKGLNDMEFKFGVGDIVRIKPGNILNKYVGAIGIVREQENVPWLPNPAYVIEMPKSVVDNTLILDSGIRINGMQVEGKDLELVEYGILSEAAKELWTTISNQRVNNKYNTWEIRIRPSDDDKDFTCAELYVNGRFENREFVKRYHEDEYNVGTACVEVCKKLFGVKNVKESEEKISVPKYYTGKVICTGDTKYFTKGKIYKVENGTIYSDGGKEFIKFESLEQLNAFRLFVNANFIEFVE